MEENQEEGIAKYLTMQKTFYDVEAQLWTVDNREPVVGSFDRHNKFEAYDTILFRDIDTSDKVALEYGCGPGRNLVRYHSRFKSIDGTDISQHNLDKAVEWCNHNKVSPGHLKICDGKSIPFANAQYDVVFSVICLQHICVYDIRLSIFKDVHRVLKPNGYFCFQMAYGGRHGATAAYYDNCYDAGHTNGGMDVAIDNTEWLEDDLLQKVGFERVRHELTEVGPGDTHHQWIWVQAQKGAAGEWKTRV